MNNAYNKFVFDDIKIVLCSEGYNLNYQYVVREIGFWSNGISASIPFNVKLNKNHLDEKNRSEILFCEQQLNGIKLKRNFENGLAASDIKPVLKTLFHMNNNPNGKYIGIRQSDIQLEGLLYKAGLGNHVVHLENLANLPKFPDLQWIRDFIKSNPNKHIICQLHDRLKINEPANCAKVKAEIIADWIKLSKDIEREQDQRLQELWSEYTLTESWNDHPKEYKSEENIALSNIPK